MKKILINYAHNAFYNSQERNSITGLEIGGFTHTKKYRFDNLDDNFKKENEFILSQPRGAGYWLWKPYIILKTLNEMQQDDILFYCDSAIDFIDNMDEYFNLCMNDKNGVLLFYNNHHLNYIWTKRDCFKLMNLDYLSPPGDPTPCPPYSRQLNASIQMCKKTEFSLHFFNEYLNFAKDARILTDMPNTLGLPNYDGFREHRHDQSIASLLRFKYDVLAREDICQWGKSFRKENEKQILFHHRSKD